MKSFEYSSQVIQTLAEPDALKKIGEDQQSEKCEEKATEQQQSNAAAEEEPTLESFLLDIEGKYQWFITITFHCFLKGISSYGNNISHRV